MNKEDEQNEKKENQIVNNNQNNNENDKIKKQLKTLSITTVLSFILIVILTVICIFLIINDNDDKKNDLDNNVNIEEKEEEKENEIIDNEENNNENLEDEKEEDITDKKENNNEHLKEERELSLADSKVRELYNMIKSNDLPDNTNTKEELFVGYLSESFLYRREKTMPIDFNEWHYFGPFIAAAIRGYKFEYKENNSIDPCAPDTITKSELKKVLYKLFGENYSIDNFSNHYFKYIEEDDSYSFGICIGDISADTLYTKLIKATIRGDYIYIYEKIGIINAGGYTYSSNAIPEKNSAKQLNGKTIWDYEDDLSTYKYTFKKGEDGEYHFYSGEYTEIK